MDLSKDEINYIIASIRDSNNALKYTYPTINEEIIENVRKDGRLIIEKLRAFKGED